MYPYDALEEYELPYDGMRIVKNTWEANAARAVIENLRDRRAIKRGFENIDHAVRVEIVETLAEIIGRTFLATRYHGGFGL